MRKVLLVILVLAASAFAECSGSAWHYLPAVLEDSGVLVNMSLALEPGNGDLFMSVYPKVGMSTQQSARDAVDYAFEYTGADREACDARIKAYMPSGVEGYIEGPSAGAAMAVMGIAALGGKSIREDAVITGAIGYDGELEPVGGLYEKAKIAESRGIKYFLSPPQSLYERIMLGMLQQNGSMKVLEIGNVSEAAGFLVDGKNISGEKKPPRVDEVDDSVPAYGGSARFAGMARGMMALFGQSVQEVDPKLKSDEMLDPYFSKIALNQEKLYGRGYYFSAANDAFLAYIDTETIANVDNLDVGKKKEEARACLASTGLPGLSENNLEWFAGAELRKAWASKKLDEMEGKNYTLKEEKYLGYHDAMYADAWCNIAGMLDAGAPKYGKELDEGALMNLSSEYLRAAEEMAGQSGDADVIWHLENAEAMHRREEYAGSILDSVFAIEMENASMIYAEDEGKATAELEDMSKEERSSLWAEAYAGHGNYVLWKGSNETAYGLLRFAKGLDLANARMAAEAGAGRGLLSPEEAELLKYGAVLAVLGIAFVLAYRLLDTGKRGEAKQKNNVFKFRKRK